VGDEIHPRGQQEMDSPPHSPLWAVLRVSIEYPYSCSLPPLDAFRGFLHSGFLTVTVDDESLTAIPQENPAEQSTDPKHSRRLFAFECDLARIKFMGYPCGYHRTCWALSLLFAAEVNPWGATKTVGTNRNPICAIFCIERGTFQQSRIVALQHQTAVRYSVDILLVDRPSTMGFAGGLGRSETTLVREDELSEANW
jgi:hypothetical protein